MALGYMAVGKHKKALKELVRACLEHDPLTAWLSLWPVFGAFRSTKEFQTMMKHVRERD